MDGPEGLADHAFWSARTKVDRLPDDGKRRSSAVRTKADRLADDANP